MNRTIIEQKRLAQLQNFMETNWGEFSQIDNPYDEPVNELYHYTQISTLFDILESDSLWLSGLRFSNDASEEKVMGEEWLKNHQYSGDNFVLSLSSEHDLLSQWRGYCPMGGAAIGLYVEDAHKYSVLCSDYDLTKKHIDVAGSAIPLLYLFAKEETKFHSAKAKIHYTGLDVQYVARRFMDNIGAILSDTNNKNDYSLLDEIHFIPYIKHNAFNEERERRVVISNSDGALSACIRFRKLTNGTKIPYIIIKNGCVDEFHAHAYSISDDNLGSLAGYLGNTSKPILLPVCSNQSDLYYAMKTFIAKKSDNAKSVKTIVCDGHLPITSIRIAPMPDQWRIKEQVERFCKSRYWLRDVTVCTSAIPFVPSINSQL